MYKRIFASLFAVSLILSGCKNIPAETEEVTQQTAQTIPAETTEATTAPIFVVQQQPMLAIALSLNNEKDADGNTVIYEHIYQNIELIIPKADIASRIISDFKSRTDTGDTAHQISQWAAETYQDNQDGWNRYLCQVTYVPTRFDGSALSLYGTHAFFADIYMSDGYNKAVTYDLTTGHPITLAELLPKISREELVSYVNSELQNLGEDIELFAEYQDIVKQRFSGTLSQEQDWYLTNEGLCFFFSPYDIAPRSSGTITVQIPYSQLAGKMDDAYFPPEQDTALGDIKIIDFSDSNAQNFTQFANVIITEGEKKSILYTDQSVTNITLELGRYEDNVFTPQHTIFSSPILTPGDAVTIEYSGVDLNSMRLTYNSLGETHHCYFDSNSHLIYTD